jgi:hypothetical protein
VIGSEISGVDTVTDIPSPSNFFLWYCAEGDKEGQGSDQQCRHEFEKPLPMRGDVAMRREYTD